MKAPIRSWLSGCILLGAICLTAPAQSRTGDDAESGRILFLESIWNEAEVKHDVHALNLLLAETFQYTDSDGSFMNRAQWLAHVGSGVDRYEHLGNRGTAVHLYGNVAIVTGEYIEKLKVKGKLLVHSGRFTDTWIQQNGEWKCVASQSTLISP